MSDALSLVRQATVTGTPVNYSDGNYTFGEFKFHESTKTFFKRSLKSNEYYYTLKDIIFFLENADINVAEYRRKVVEARLTAVVEQDRHALKDYLTGVIDTCPQIDLVAAAEFTRSTMALASSAATAQHRAEQPEISLERMQEQRERHAAMLDSTMVKTKIASDPAVSGATVDKLEELRNRRKAQKRKLNEGGMLEAGEDALIDKAYIEADRLLLARLRADETPVFTRSTVLTTSEMNFQSVLKLFNERILKPKETTSAKPAAPASATASGSGNAHKSGHKEADRGDPRAAAPAATAATAGAGSSDHHNRPVSSQQPSGRSPIIIVPSAVTSCITTMNAKDLFVDGLYIPADVKKAAGARREKEQSILRPGSNIHYKIIDDPTRLSDADWQRVVAVLATGQTWQFKGWKHSNPAQLFQQVQGIHITLDDRAVDPTILTWNCKVLKVNQFKQHLNAAASKEFWTHVDDFVRLNKPQMAAAQKHMMQRPAESIGSGGGGVHAH